MAVAPDRRRTADEVLADLLSSRSGYIPNWDARPRDPALGVVSSQAEILSYLWERLHGAADKNKISLLAELGIDRLPPAAARAPVEFEPLTGSGNAQAPAGSLVGATTPDGEQLTFRTETGIGLSSSPLAEVWSVIPGQDTGGDHTADVRGQRPFRLFSQQVRTVRSLYIGHDQLLAMAGSAEIGVEFELARAAEPPLELSWAIWDGSVWREFLDLRDNDTVDQVTDGTGGLMRSGTVVLASDGIESSPTKVHGIESHWLRCEMKTRLSDSDRWLPQIDQIRLAVKFGSPTEQVEFRVESAVALGQDVDLSAPFYPFGQSPDRTTHFYLDAADMADSGLGTCTVSFDVTFDAALDGTVVLALEYWDGSSWRPLSASAGGDTATITIPGSVTSVVIDRAFAIPQNWEQNDVGGAPGRWMRIRVLSGSFDRVETVGTSPNDFEVHRPAPPLFSDLLLKVYGVSPAAPPDHVVTQDRARFQERTSEARYRGTPFEPFAPNPDASPALYLGFDGELPAAAIGLYFDIEPAGTESSHEFRWERYDGRHWGSIPVLDDETAHLTRTGIVRLLWPGNRSLRSVSPVVAEGTTATTLRSGEADVFEAGEEVFVKEGETGELAHIASVTGRTITLRRALENSYQNATLSQPELPLFGTPRTWIRARLTEEGIEPDITVRRLITNATWASEARTVDNEIIGSGGGRPGEVMSAARRPILPGELLQVRELTGARARTDLAILEREFADHPGTVEAENDPVTGDVNAAWVRWEPRPNLLSSGPEDRHYVVDRVAGTIRFGDGRHGRVPPMGTQNVRLRRYDTGGGRRGNLAAGAIDAPLSGIVAQRVGNPVAASGGADAETPERAIKRAPHVLRHRYQAVTSTDYRDVALEASPEVFEAAVLLAGDDLGGQVRVVVLPDSDAAPPEPSAQLLERVRRHLLLRCPTGARGRLRVVPPKFVEVGVDVVVAPAGDQAGAVFDAVRAEIAVFLHAVKGGPGGSGWRFGARVHAALFFPRLEALPGVDYIESFSVTRNGAIAGDEVRLDSGDLPTVGDIVVRLTSEATL